MATADGTCTPGPAAASATGPLLWLFDALLHPLCTSPRLVPASVAPDAAVLPLPVAGGVVAACLVAAAVAWCTVARARGLSPVGPALLMVTTLAALALTVAPLVVAEFQSGCTRSVAQAVLAAAEWPSVATGSLAPLLPWRGVELDAQPSAATFAAEFLQRAQGLAMGLGSGVVVLLAGAFALPSAGVAGAAAGLADALTVTPPEWLAHALPAGTLPLPAGVGAAVNHVLALVAASSLVAGALAAFAVVVHALWAACRGSLPGAAATLWPAATTGALALALHAGTGWGLGHPAWAALAALAAWLGLGVSPLAPFPRVPATPVGVTATAKAPLRLLHRRLRHAAAGVVLAVAGLCVHTQVRLALRGAGGFPATVWDAQRVGMPRGARRDRVLSALCPPMRACARTLVRARVHSATATATAAAAAAATATATATAAAACCCCSVSVCC
jgi:hypothetical protein